MKQLKNLYTLYLKFCPCSYIAYIAGVPVRGEQKAAAGEGEEGRERLPARSVMLTNASN